MNLAPYITSIFNFLNLLYQGLVDYWYIILSVGAIALIARVVISVIRGK